MPKAQPLLLDLYPNASVAYSLRKLRTAYTGSAIRVRRSVDNAEQDFGFVNNVLDTASLLSFVGAGNGFVTRIYDQSGTNNFASQSTQNRQPQIVSSGSLITKNGKPTMRMFAETTERFMEELLSSTIATVGFSSFLVASYQSDSISSYYGLSSTSTNNQYAHNGFNGVFLELAATFRNGTEFLIRAFNPIYNQLYLTSYIPKTATDRDFFVNNTNAYNSTTSSTSFNATYVLLNRIRRSDIIAGRGDFSEFILYANNQSFNRNGIESNINQYYGIY